MTKREELHAAFIVNDLKIEELKKENIDLTRESFLLCDDKQWYKEEMKDVKQGKNKSQRLIGMVCWNENFKDEDTGAIVTIERSQAVKVDGEWI